MRKLMAVMLVLAVAVAAQADLRTYNSLFTAANVPLTGTEVDGDGFGWAVSFDSSTLGEVDETTALTLGWITGFGYTVNAGSFTVNELDTVSAVLYDAPSSGSALNFIVSAPVVVPDLTDPIAPGSNEVTFDFSGSSWEAIPEPATIGLMGIAGLGMFLARKKVRA
mgnify:CR=1 FL=1